MRKLAASSLAIALVACSSAGDDAAKQYEIVSAHGSPMEQCAAAKRAASAYLADHNESKYAEWTKKAKDDCLIARMSADAADLR